MSQPVHEPAGQLHEQQCFACWLRALGADPDLAAAISSAGFIVGYSEAMTSLGISAALVMPMAASPARTEAIGRITRQLMAAPPSADVAEASHGGGPGV